MVINQSIKDPAGHPINDAIKLPGNQLVQQFRWSIMSKDQNYQVHLTGEKHEKKISDLTLPGTGTKCCSLFPHKCKTKTHVLL